MFTASHIHFSRSLPIFIHLAEMKDAHLVKSLDIVSQYKRGQQDLERLLPLLATVGLWVNVSHDQALFQPCAMTMGHSERSVLPESTICRSIPPAVALQSNSSLSEP